MRKIPTIWKIMHEATVCVSLFEITCEAVSVCHFRWYLVSPAARLWIWPDVGKLQHISLHTLWRKLSVCQTQPGCFSIFACHSLTDENTFFLPFFCCYSRKWHRWSFSKFTCHYLCSSNVSELAHSCNVPSWTCCRLFSTAEMLPDWGLGQR